MPPMVVPAAALALLACPVCHGQLEEEHAAGAAEIVCAACGRRYPVRDGIQVLLAAAATLPSA